MRKNDLIKLLEQIEGNPEIVLWNGYANDWVAIGRNLIEGKLVKQNLSGYLENCRLRRAYKQNEPNLQLSSEDIARLTEQYKSTINWVDDVGISYDASSAWQYTKKRVVYITPKLRGKGVRDHRGKLTY